MSTIISLSAHEWTAPSHAWTAKDLQSPAQARGHNSEVAPPEVMDADDLWPWVPLPGGGLELCNEAA
ncbi:MAG: hypothetical protein M3552_11280 [Planctomycetota bacterium]|nr:hypothetical protein [Planctomycetaceae bacterium]MDQ3331219.1 hypothetical protein [Planctomycetota bacterium]